MPTSVLASRSTNKFLAVLSLGSISHARCEQCGAGAGPRGSKRTWFGWNAPGIRWCDRELVGVGSRAVAGWGGIGIRGAKVLCLRVCLLFHESVTALRSQFPSTELWDFPAEPRFIPAEFVWWFHIVSGFGSVWPNLPFYDCQTNAHVSWKSHEKITFCEARSFHWNTWLNSALINRSALVIGPYMRTEVLQTSIWIWLALEKVKVQVKVKSWLY